MEQLEKNKELKGFTDESKKAMTQKGNDKEADSVIAKLSNYHRSS